MQQANELLIKAQGLVSKVRQNKGHDAQVFISKNDGLSIAYQNGQLDQLTFESENQLFLKLYRGDRVAMVSSSDLADDSLNRCLNKAYSMIEFSDHDACHGLPEPQWSQSNHSLTDLQLYHPYQVATDFITDICAEMEQVAQDIVGVSQTESIAYFQNEMQAILLNTSGFEHIQRSTYFSWHAAMIAGSEQDMVSDYEYSAARCFEDLTSPTTVARAAAEKAVAQQQPRKIADQNCPVILSSQLARGFIQDVLRALSGPALYKNASFLVNQVGNEIFSNNMSLYEKPHLLRALGSSWFDQEGVATSNQSMLVSNGVLQRYVLDCYSARQLGLTTTANSGGVHNLIVECQETLSWAELVKKCYTGVYITHWMGQGVNISTGDFSKGARGFWIDHGVVQYPIHELTIAATLPKMMRGIAAMSAEIDRRGNIRCGALLIDNMTVSC